MNGVLLLEHALNGLQFGLMLFLLAAGLTLIFGIMDFINLAHGSLYMAGAYFAATFTELSGSFWLGLAGAVLATALVGAVLEVVLFRRLYRRDHMAQVLATFALILVFNDAVRMVWGTQPLSLNTPAALSLSASTRICARISGCSRSASSPSAARKTAPLAVIREAPHDRA